MTRQSLGTWIAVVAFSLVVTGASALVIEDAGKHPYRSWQKSSGKQPPEPVQHNWDDFQDLQWPRR